MSLSEANATICFVTIVSCECFARTPCLLFGSQSGFFNVGVELSRYDGATRDKQTTHWATSLRTVGEDVRCWQVLSGGVIYRCHNQPHGLYKLSKKKTRTSC